MGPKPTLDPFPLFAPKVGQTQIRRNPAPLSQQTSIPLTADGSAVILAPLDWRNGLGFGGIVPENISAVNPVRFGLHLGRKTGSIPADG